jgi:acetyltransferase-like isoleucine patch superfamily enzyme
MFAFAISHLLILRTRLRTRLFTWIIKPLFGDCGSCVRICPPFRFANLQQVKIGRDVVVNRDSWIGVVSDRGDERSIKLSIGSGCAIGMGATISAASSIVLEDDVLLARNVYISDHGHAFKDVTQAIKNQGITSSSAVRIGRGTWLGQNVVVLPGVTIGEHCVIGANAVVRQSIPARSVAVGIPARIIKQFNDRSGLWENLPR